MVAVLDNFHFDLSSLRSPSHEEGEKVIDTSSPGGEHQASSGQTRSQELPQDEYAEEIIEHKDKTPEELEMEEDDNKDEEGKSVEEDELTEQRAMAQKIHKSIVNSILPSLEAVLTKRVSILHATYV